MDHALPTMETEVALAQQQAAQAQQQSNLAIQTMLSHRHYPAPPAADGAGGIR